MAKLNILGAVSSEPVTRQEYIVQLHRHQALKIKAGEFSQLLAVGLISIKKDKVIPRDKERVRLLVAQLISPLHQRAYCWSEFNSGRVHIEIERHLQQYAEIAVANALRSLLGIMIKQYASAA